ncbi:hypothetical protein BD324DRAFT_651941 [Kockovaella imperatae]|uniref:Uncharacterized protein n=1 Tax=Kockovaella imperatae TaxID=4999 RepID=A0A1Y1UES8_9TREE|nr:hypothetical protein BD324DRAFT_651941 [Kockovaella imperatae]ORX36037.1 hypothetical protein BD324DRAFT_651941 [Kockovaella imperatae]
MASPTHTFASMTDSMASSSSGTHYVSRSSNAKGKGRAIGSDDSKSWINSIWQTRDGRRQWSTRIGISTSFSDMLLRAQRHLDLVLRDGQALNVIQVRQEGKQIPIEDEFDWDALKRLAMASDDPFWPVVLRVHAHSGSPRDASSTLARTPKAVKKSATSVSLGLPSASNDVDVSRKRTRNKNKAKRDKRRARRESRRAETAALDQSEPKPIKRPRPSSPTSSAASPRPTRKKRRHRKDSSSGADRIGFPTLDPSKKPSHNTAPNYRPVKPSPLATAHDVSRKIPAPDPPPNQTKGRAESESAAQSAASRDDSDSPEPDPQSAIPPQPVVSLSSNADNAESVALSSPIEPELEEQGSSEIGADEKQTTSVKDPEGLNDDTSQNQSAEPSDNESGGESEDAAEDESRSDSQEEGAQAGERLPTSPIAGDRPWSPPEEESASGNQSSSQHELDDAKSHISVSSSPDPLADAETSLSPQSPTKAAEDELVQETVEIDPPEALKSDVIESASESEEPNSDPTSDIAGAAPQSSVEPDPPLPVAARAPRTHLTQTSRLLTPKRQIDLSAPWNLLRKPRSPIIDANYSSSSIEPFRTDASTSAVKRPRASASSSKDLNGSLGITMNNSATPVPPKSRKKSQEDAASSESNPVKEVSDVLISASMTEKAPATPNGDLSTDLPSSKAGRRGKKQGSVSGSTRRAEIAPDNLADSIAQHPIREATSHQALHQALPAEGSDAQQPTHGRSASRASPVERARDGIQSSRASIEPAINIEEGSPLSQVDFSISKEPAVPLPGSPSSRDAASVENVVLTSAPTSPKPVTPNGNQDPRPKRSFRPAAKRLMGIDLDIRDEETERLGIDDQKAVLASRGRCSICLSSPLHLQKDCPSVKAGVESLERILEERKLEAEAQMKKTMTNRRKSRVSQETRDSIDAIESWIRRLTTVRNRVMGLQADVADSPSAELNKPIETQPRLPPLLQKVLSRPNRAGSASVSVSDAFIETGESESETDATAEESEQEESSNDEESSDSEDSQTSLSLDEPLDLESFLKRPPTQDQLRRARLSAASMQAVQPPSVASEPGNGSESEDEPTIQQVDSASSIGDFGESEKGDSREESVVRSHTPPAVASLAPEEAVDEESLAVRSADRSANRHRSFMALRGLGSSSPVVDMFDGAQALQDGIDEERTPLSQMVGLPSPILVHDEFAPTQLRGSQKSQSATKSSSLAPAAEISSHRQTSARKTGHSNAIIEKYRKSQLAVDKPQTPPSGPVSQPSNVSPAVSKRSVSKEITVELSPKTRTMRKSLVPTSEILNDRARTPERASAPSSSASSTGLQLDFMSGLGVKTPVQASPVRTRSSHPRLESSSQPQSKVDQIDSTQSTMASGATVKRRRSSRNASRPSNGTSQSSVISSRRGHSSMPDGVSDSFPDSTTSVGWKATPIAEASDEPESQGESESDDETTVPIAPPIRLTRSTRPESQPTTMMPLLSSLPKEMLRSRPSTNFGAASQPLPITKPIESSEGEESDSASSSDDDNVPADKRARFATGSRAKKKKKSNGKVHGW